MYSDKTRKTVWKRSLISGNKKDYQVFGAFSEVTRNIQ